MLLGFFFLCVLCEFLLSTDGNEREVRIASWNVNGVRKFNRLPNELAFLREHDIVLLQETFSREDRFLLELNGFYSHHQRAIPGQGRRNVWGLSSFFKVTKFADGFWTKVFSPVDWLLISRWTPKDAPGIFVFNTYVPAHTAGIDPNEISALKSTLEELVCLYPGDTFLLAGDFNLDRFKDTSGTRISQ
jgi:exonuclease III